jgi:hypothetical protein
MSVLLFRTPAPRRVRSSATVPTSRLDPPGLRAFIETEMVPAERPVTLTRLSATGWEVMNVPNPYDVERSWPDYFLEHRRLTVERQGTYRCGDLPVWTIHCPLGYLGNSTVIEGEDGLIVYDTGVNPEAGAHIAREASARRR